MYIIRVCYNFKYCCCCSCCCYYYLILRLLYPSGRPVFCNDMCFACCVCTIQLRNSGWSNPKLHDVYLFTDKELIKIYYATVLIIVILIRPSVRRFSSKFFIIMPRSIWCSRAVLILDLLLLFRITAVLFAIIVQCPSCIPYSMNQIQFCTLGWFFTKHLKHFFYKLPM